MKTRAQGIATAWKHVGPVTHCDRGLPSFPAVTTGPGVYRLTLADGRVYVGEAGNIDKRMSQYRKPTGIEQELWLSLCLRTVGSAQLHVVVDEGLAHQPARNKVERFEVQRLLELDVRLLNGRHDTGLDRLRHKLAYQEKQVERIKALIAARETETQ